MFFNFLSSFNTIQPAPLSKKLESWSPSSSDYIDYRLPHQQIAVRELCVWGDAMNHRAASGNGPLSVPLDLRHKILTVASRSSLMKQPSFGCLSEGNDLTYMGHQMWTTCTSTPVRWKTWWLTSRETHHPSHWWTSMAWTLRWLTHTNF